MDELEKLFAEASASVKRAVQKTDEPAAPPPPPPPTPAAPEAVAEAPEPAAPPPPPPAPARSAEPTKVSGGSRTDSGLVLTGPGGTYPVEWSQIRGVALGRTDRGQALAFQAAGALYYFEDSEMNYKGLLAPLEPTAMANWRNLVTEFSQKSGSADDPGVLAITQGAGMLPRHPSLEAFLASRR